MNRINGPATAEGRLPQRSPRFEDAWREVAGVPLDRDDFAQILHRLASRNQVVPGLSEHDACVLEEAGFIGDRIMR